MSYLEPIKFYVAVSTDDLKSNLEATEDEIHRIESNNEESWGTFYDNLESEELEWLKSRRSYIKEALRRAENGEIIFTDMEE